MGKTLVLVMVALSVVLAGQTWEQDLTYSGRVLDEQGKPMAGVVVRIEFSSSSVKKSAVTDKEGKWRILVPKPRRTVTRHVEEYFLLQFYLDGFMVKEVQYAYSRKSDGRLRDQVLKVDSEMEFRLLMVRAEQQALAGADAEASRMLRTAADLNPQFHGLLQRIGSFELKQGRLEAAGEALAKALQAARDRGDIAVGASALETLGDLQVAAGKPEQAREYFLDALASGGLDGSVLAKLGKLEMSVGRRAIALACFAEARCCQPDLALPELESPEGGSAPQDPELESILTKAANYCQKLESAAYRYFCSEEVASISRPGSWNQDKPRTWLYDYQMIGKNLKVKERRVLLEKDGQKARKKNADQETEFRSYYSFYTPIDLLSLEQQPLYSYGIVGKQKIGGSECSLLLVTPRGGRPAEGLLDGMVWVDPADGSVLRVELNSRTIGGVAERRERAEFAGALYKIKDSHWYEVMKSGLRFPSRIVFVEIYRTRSPVWWDQTNLQINFSYRDYRFFSVKTKEEKVDME